MADTEYSVVYDPALDRFAIPTQLSKMAAVYLIRNTVSENSYVGSSKNVGKRISIHLNGKSHNRPIVYDLACYGRGSFCVSILEIVENEALLDERETYWIGKLNPSNNTIRSGAHGRHAFTDERRRKISAANSVRRHSDETKRKIGLSAKGRPSPTVGAPRPQPVRDKIRAANLGNKMSPEQKAKHRAGLDRVVANRIAIGAWMLAVMSWWSK